MNEFYLMHNDNYIVFEHSHVKFECDYSHDTNVVNFKVFNDSHSYESIACEVMKKKITIFCKKMNNR